jgi:outer membrane lipoprotein SlyB
MKGTTAMIDRKFRQLTLITLVAVSSIATAQPGYPPPPPPPPPTGAICRDCGVIESIRQVILEGQSGGGGMVIGGILGGVLGHQIGHGRGKDLATVAGAAGGAYAGNQVEKSNNRAVRYDIAVRMDDGRREVIRLRDATGWRDNDRVRVINGKLSLITQ